MNHVLFRSGLVIALLGCAWPAGAQSSRVVNVIKMAAWAQVLAERCPKLAVDWSRYGGLMTIAGLQPEDIEPAGKHGKLHGAFIAEALAETGSASEAAACATGLNLYGRNGRNVPGLLAPRN